MKNIFNKIIHKFNFGNNSITLETGEIAKHTTISILGNMDNTIVLATVVKTPLKNEVNFFPLSVYYQEKYYAVGKIPGGFLRREGRPSENEILMSRLIDRSIRPLFNPPYFYEIQIFVTLLSLNPNIYPDILSIITVSTALNIAFYKYFTPVGASRIGLINNLYVLNPSVNEIKNSNLDLFFACTKKNILMIECQANNISNLCMLEALKYGYTYQKSLISNINVMTKKVLNNIHNNDIIYPKYLFSKSININFYKIIKNISKSSLIKAYKIKNKYLRILIIKQIKEEIILFLQYNFNTNIIYNQLLENVFLKLEKNILIESIFNTNIRIDGRKNDEIRNLSCKINIFPRLHGSALFTRGDTQALVTVTLGTPRDVQNIDDIVGEQKENFIFHYNFPSYAVNEISKFMAPKRREIGHGKLAKKGLIAVMPKKNFHYTIRIVSEITSSNGSSSMASVCGASLALMAAGVPIKNAVAGIAMGLIQNKLQDKYIIFSDILGDEDHLGDIDFKIIGTTNGITALQMDVKNIYLLNFQILKKIFLQAKKGINKIIKYMNKTIITHKRYISYLAPKIQTINIHPEKIKDIIGKGGIVIKQITEETGAVIEIEDNGLINIISNNNMQINNAIFRIKNLIEENNIEINVGKIYKGKVVKIVEFGAFINIHSREGLLHISNIINQRINKVSDYLQIGQQVFVKVLEINSYGQIQLSMKDVKYI